MITTLGVVSASVAQSSRGASCAFGSYLVNLTKKAYCYHGETGMSDKNFRVTYTRGTSSSVVTASVRASSASQAKEKIKERERGQAKIISAVET